jgi:hypothetical protein
MGRADGDTVGSAAEEKRVDGVPVGMDVRDPVEDEPVVLDTGDTAVTAAENPP